MGGLLMLYTEKTKMAMIYAYEKHHGQYDKGGVPYIMHPLAVAEMMNQDEDAVVVALLHDVVEDTGTSLEELLDAGFDLYIVQAVDAISRRPGEKYMDYLVRVKANPLATKVKLGDLTHNSDYSRLPEMHRDKLSMKSRYEKSFEFLKQ
jgi:(p)ppGpp synthase/HD superfamily hydrolase